MLKPESCNLCPLSHLGTSCSKRDGLGTLRVTFIGESLGHDDAIDGLPFRPYSQGGSLLAKAIRLAGYERDQFYYWNLVGCQPPGGELEGKPWYGAIDHCRRTLWKEYVQGNNNVLVALGNVALKELTGVTAVASDKMSISHLRGYVAESQWGLVVPAYHPSYVKRGNLALTPTLIWDINKAVDIARGLWSDYPGGEGYVEPTYGTHISVSQAERYYEFLRNHPKAVIAYDIETPNDSDLDEDERELNNQKLITSIQFSHKKKFGMFFPWEGEFVEIAKAILNLSNLKMGFNNWRFDDIVLARNDVHIEGLSYDIMWMFKHFHPQLPRGLQAVASMFRFPFPWKHYYGERFRWYGCADVDALHYIYDDLPRKMKNVGCWDGWLEQVYGLEPILRRATTTGIGVSEEKRQVLKVQLEEKQKEIDKELQTLIPNELKNVEPKKKGKNGQIQYGYVRTPPEVRTWTNYYNHQVWLAGSKGKQVKTTLDEFVLRKTGLVLRTFVEYDEFMDVREVQRWCRIQDFKPSKEQLVRYIKWRKRTLESSNSKVDKDLSKKYYIPQMFVKKGAGRKQETTGKAELKQLIDKTQDKVLDKVLEFRSVSKMLNNDIPNWEPREDEKVHPTFYYVPPTGQLNCRNPNAQNCSKHSDVGQLFRGIVEAPKGFTYVEFDYRAFHVVMLGREAESKNYIKFAKLDPHSIFTSWICGDEGLRIDIEHEADESIKAKVKEIKKRFKDIRSRRAKVVVLGNQNGLGPRKLYWDNRKYLDSEAQAREYQSILNEPYPEIQRWRDRIVKEASDTNKLVTEFGRVRWFYDVTQNTYDKKSQSWVMRRGNEYNDAIAHRIHANAFGMITEKILECEQVGINAEYNFVDTIHDSIIFMPREEEVKELVRRVHRIMTQPCLRLANSACPEGLKVDVEVSVGRNWQSWDGERNIEGMREIRYEEYGL